MLNVELISDFDSFLQLEEEWNSLLEKTSTNTVFLRHEWFKCWWKAYGVGKKLCILLIKQEDKLIGISPLMISRDHFRGFPVRKIGFIENNETARSDFITLYDQSRIIEETITYLIQKRALWDVLIFNKIPMDTDTPKVLQTACRKKGVSFLRRPSLHSPFLRIDTDWDTFYKNTSQKFKKKLRYNNNRLKKLGNISIEKLSQAINAEACLADVFAIGQKSWISKIGKSISSNRETKLFFSELAHTASTRGWLSIWLMKAGDKPVAFEYHLEYNNNVHALRSEFNNEYSAYSPGSVLHSHIVKYIFLNRFKEYDMGGSADTYKKRWTPSVRQHCNILAFNKGFYPQFLRFLEDKLIPSLKQTKAGILFKALLANLNKRRINGAKNVPNKKSG